MSRCDGFDFNLTWLSDGGLKRRGATCGRIDDGLGFRMTHVEIPCVFACISILNLGLCLQSHFFSYRVCSGFSFPDQSPILVHCYFTPSGSKHSHGIPDINRVLRGSFTQGRLSPLSTRVLLGVSPSVLQTKH